MVSLDRGREGRIQAGQLCTCPSPTLRRSACPLGPAVSVKEREKSMWGRRRKVSARAEIGFTSGVRGPSSSLHGGEGVREGAAVGRGVSGRLCRSPIQHTSAAHPAKPYRRPPIQRTTLVPHTTHRPHPTHITLPQGACKHQHRPPIQRTSSNRTSHHCCPPHTTYLRVPANTKLLSCSTISAPTAVRAPSVMCTLDAQRRSISRVTVSAGGRTGYISD